MTIINPTQLVDEFKKSGEFDRLRRELLAQFQRSDSAASFTPRVQDIARQRLLSDQRLQFMPPDAAHRELMKEMDRYPIVERTVGELQMLADPSFLSTIRNSVTQILKEDRARAALPDVKPLACQPAGDTILHEVSPQSAVITPAEVTISNAVQAETGLNFQSHGTMADTSIPVTQMPDGKDTVGTPVFHVT